MFPYRHPADCWPCATSRFSRRPDWPCGSRRRIRPAPAPPAADLARSCGRSLPTCNSLSSAIWPRLARSHRSLSMAQAERRPLLRRSVTRPLSCVAHAIVENYVKPSLVKQGAAFEFMANLRHEPLSPCVRLKDCGRRAGHGYSAMRSLQYMRISSALPGGSADRGRRTRSLRALAPAARRRSSIVSLSLCPPVVWRAEADAVAPRQPCSEADFFLTSVNLGEEGQAWTVRWPALRGWSPRCRAPVQPRRDSDRPSSRARELFPGGKERLRPRSLKVLIALVRRKGGSREPQ